MAEYEAANQVDYELYRKYPDIFETVVWKLNQELAEKILNELADGKTRLVTLGPAQRIEENGVNAVRFTKGVKIESLVRCRECKHLCVRSGALGVYQCAIHGDYPSGEYFCADGERRDGGQDE